jgi:tetratricopeptide (TPR) repeat protein
MILYRPVGLQELALIYDSGMQAFPARLPQQPIFYPVLQLEYARQTASNWNAQNGQFAGYVTQFKVEEPYISQFEQHTVGESEHEELWIPAEEVETFNKHIVGHIKVVEAHFGDAFQGFIPEKFGLQGKNVVEQFTMLANSFIYKRMDFYLEIKRNHKAVFLNYPFWQKYEFKNPGLKEKVLQAIKEAWLTSFPKIPLPLPPPVHEDTSPAQQTYEDLQSVLDPVQEESTPDEQTDSYSLAKHVAEDLAPMKKSYAQTLVEPLEEQGRRVEPTDSQSLVKPVPKDTAPVKQPYSRSVVNPPDKEVTPVTPAESRSFVKPVPEDVTPVRQSYSQSSVEPLDQGGRRVRQTDVHEHFSQGLVLGLSGRHHEAINELSKAVEGDPNHVVAHTSLGVAFHRLGEEDRALLCYEAALKINPGYAEAHYFRANILYSQGNAREAITEYTIAIGLEPELIAYHEQSTPQDRLTDYSPAPAGMNWIARPARRILELNKALESDPRQANLFKERAAQYSRLWNYEQAIEDYSSALTLQPEDATALHSRGSAYEQIQQLDRALEDYQRAIAINPQLSDLYFQRGVTLGKMGNFRQSIASLTEGLRLAPDNADGYFNRGTSYFQLGDLVKAIDDFSTVIKLSSDDEAAYYWRGISNEEAGRQREAIADYRQFLALSRDENARAEIEQKLSLWNAGDRNGAKDRSIVPSDRQTTKQVPSREPDQKLDLYGLVAVLGKRALQSTWFGSGVECYGEKAEDLYAFTAQDRPIEGKDFLRLTAGIHQTIQGDFQAFDQGATSHWIFIRAWDGSGFYIETDDPQIVDQLKAHFEAMEEVEGASPPYEGLFIRT